MAPMAIPFLFSFLIMLLSFPSSSLSKITAITIFPPFPSSSQKFEPWQRINQLAAASRSRAQYLKRHKNNIHSPTETNVLPSRFGGYHISLSFGTPPQALYFIIDTGSSETWFPCTNYYECTECDFQGMDPRMLSTFIPGLSASAKILGCKSPTCGRILESDVLPACKDCNDESQNCPKSCPYSIAYGSGSTSGILLSETLRFPNKNVKNFIVGCSIQSTSVPTGIAGFGREPASLPSQMGLKKFSYCLVSHKFDDTQKTSELIMVAAGEDDDSIGQANLSYTPFGKPPKIYETFYYLIIKKIIVGRVDVKVPTRFLVPGPSGVGGTIIDSGTTLTTMDNEVYELVVKEFEKQMQHYIRAPDVENQVHLGLCYNVSGGKSVNFPELTLHLAGGAKMEFPMSDNFEAEPEVFCLTLLSSKVMGLFGPSIILGNYHQQNLYLEFDLENERLGFRRQIC